MFLLAGQKINADGPFGMVKPKGKQRGGFVPKDLSDEIQMISENKQPYVVQILFGTIGNIFSFLLPNYNSLKNNS